MYIISKRFSLASLTSFALTFVTALLLSAAAQAQNKEYTPSVGQEGKDVIWVPTPNELIAKMLDMAKLTPNDVHFDLGSGDGRTVIAAAKRGATATGVEFNKEMVALSERAAKRDGVTDKAKFINGDIFTQQSIDAYSKANVITLFLLPDLNVKLRPNLLNMKPGTRIVANTFTMEDWQADQTETVTDGCSSSWCTALFWIVPAVIDSRFEVLPERWSYLTWAGPTASRGTP